MADFPFSFSKKNVPEAQKLSAPANKGFDLVLADAFPLNPLETALKAWWLSNAKHLSPLDPFKVLARLGNSGYPILQWLKESKTLLEKQYMSLEHYLKIQSDFSVFLHPRYLPPFPHSQDFIQILYVYSGSCQHVLAGQTYCLERGDVSLIPPGLKHELSVCSDDSLILHFVFPSKTIPQVFRDIFKHDDPISRLFTQVVYEKTTCHPCLLFHTGEDQSLSKVAQFILSETNAKDSYHENLMNHSLMLFVSLLQRGYGDQPEVLGIKGPSRDRNIFEITRYLVENASRVSLSQAARHFAYTEVYFSRLLKRHTGLPFSQFVRSLKAQQAAQLLRNPQQSLNTIMEIVGFNDMSHFYKVFKKTYGMTPQEFRRSLKQEARNPA